MPGCDQSLDRWMGSQSKESISCEAVRANETAKQENRTAKGVESKIGRKNHAAENENSLSEPVPRIADRLHRLSEHAHRFAENVF